MSNNTVIPGMMGAGPMAGPQQPMGGFPQFPGNAAANTVIPGVAPANFPNPQAAPKGQLFGFLFSVSKTMAGEYWPIYLGANTIGRGAQNSIQLGEATVSDVHASIHVICRDGQLTVYIADSASKTGTLLNGQLVRGEADLKNGDILTIGEAYALYVILVNPAQIGLAQVEKFQEVAAGPQPVAPMGNTIPYTPGTPFGPAAPSPFPGMQQPQAPHGGSATVVEGQGGAAPMGGHTVVMPGGNGGF